MSPLADLSAHVILALTSEQIRLLAVAGRVSWANGEPDVRQWARMCAMPLDRVRDLSRGLVEMGAILPDGTVHKTVHNYLSKLARDRLV